jgi:hypothetical protein
MRPLYEDSNEFEGQDAIRFLDGLAHGHIEVEDPSLEVLAFSELSVPIGEGIFLIAGNTYVIRNRQGRFEGSINKSKVKNAIAIGSTNDYVIKIQLKSFAHDMYFSFSTPDMDRVEKMIEIISK